MIKKNCIKQKRIASSYGLQVPAVLYLYTVSRIAGTWFSAFSVFNLCAKGNKPSATAVLRAHLFRSSVVWLAVEKKMQISVLVACPFVTLFTK